VLARAYAVSDPGEVADPDYLAGLKATVRAALDYGIAGLESGAESHPPVPPQLIAQARGAARNGVSLDTVLRRYFGGYSLLSDFVIREAESGGALDAAELQELLRSLSTLFDAAVATIAREYSEEAAARVSSAGQRRAQKVRRLLAGELLDVSELRYDFDAWHLGGIVTGPGAAAAIRELAGSLDRCLLTVPSGGRSVWVWLGGKKELGAPEAIRAVEAAGWPGHLLLALGEPGHGLDGWRITHRQASAALPVAQCGTEKVVRYLDVALLGSVLRDELLSGALTDAYLAPLAEERDGGAALRETLCAYFAAGRQVSSAAASLGVSRQTVGNRLRAIERRIGRPLDSCAVEIEMALRLECLSN